jgi:hypothetical protein
MDITTFEHVTPENFDRLKVYLQHNDCTGLDGNEGTAIGACLNLGYRFDPAAGTLDLTAASLPANLETLPDELRIRAGRKLLGGVMGIGQPPRTMMLDANAYPYKPGRYGVYDYCLPYINNNTGHAFTFQDAPLTNGTMYSNLQTIPVGAAQLNIFEADSTKLSGTGVGGTVHYIWADNTTIMTITFFLNTIYTHSFTVGFSTTTLTATITDTDPSLDGYTYLDPQITVTV